MLTMLTVLSAIAIATPEPANSEGWEIVLDVPGQSSRAIGIDPVAPSEGPWPHLIMAGLIDGSSQSGTPNKIFRLSQSDSPIAGVVEPLHASGALVYSLASEPAGALLFAGTLNPLNTGNKWIVRRSPDNGASWSELLRWDLEPGIYSRARGLTVDAAGNLFVCGMAGDSDGYAHWLVLKRNNDVASWSIVDNVRASSSGFAFYANNGTEAMGTALVPGAQNAVYVVGAQNNTWTVKRSHDNGLHWPVVDAWTPKRGQATHALKVSSDSGGRVFVLGGVGSAESPQWVVRMSDNGGLHWRTIFGPWSSGSHQRPNDLTVDAADNVWIGGIVYTAVSAKGKTTWTSIPTVVRLQPGSTGDFTPTRYSLPQTSAGSVTYYDAGVNAITADSLGNVYISGSYTPDSGTSWRWFAQRFVR